MIGLLPRLGVRHRVASVASMLAQLLGAALFAAGATALATEPNWTAVGPAGGDARALAAVPGHPEHLYLGTTTSWIYESKDGGASWQRLARLDGSDALILDSIVVDSSDPSVLYVAAWKTEGTDGGLWVSRDAGKTWAESAGLHGQSIRAFIQAPSDPKVLFAGTLEGVFRSSDAGTTWNLISPAGSHEIHEVESLAVDPGNPDIVYAGTWHLPWKTTDGGKNWHNIKKGLIDDSDVFSIVIDPNHPKIVYLSACSGIYKSETAGELFRKIQGIPSEARRTRVLMQDPEDPRTVYAGTTEGLYKTTDSGHSFTRMTGDDVIVNDVYVDPADTQHVLLATDRGGVLASSDAGATFAVSNSGFSGRKVEALLVDRDNPARLYAGIVNDKAFGSVFVSNNGGAAWEHIGDGLDGRDVYALAQAPDGMIVAGTSHGIFALNLPGAKAGQDASRAVAADAKPADPLAPAWQPRNIIANTSVKAAVENLHGKRIDVEKHVKDALRQLDSRVNALDLGGNAWLAATTGGLFTSRDQGATWQGGPVMGAGDYLSVASMGSTLAAAAPDRVVLSSDAGLTWMPMQIPAMLTRIHRVVFSPDGTIWLGAREGVYFTPDKGKKWMWIERLPFRDVDDLCFDARTGSILASSRSSDQVYAIDPKTLDWKWWQTGYRIALVRASGDRLVAASLYDGVLVEPKPAGSETGNR
jgi:photosystem II stability/assembly factor-like uncharacterized protein